MTALALAVLAVGCGFAGSERDDMEEKLATLAQRPTIEAIRATYEDMQARLRDRLSAEVGLLQWVNDQNLSGAGCADFPNVGGQSLTLDRWTSEGNLPDTQWDTAVRIVAEVTSEYGFGSRGWLWIDRTTTRSPRPTGTEGTTFSAPPPTRC
ncbi:MAG: LppA family lipoprotein [Actinomycetota bacterium]|nr:LppA family lipoprotein [Actinomycetota bacterium]